MRKVKPYPETHFDTLPDQVNEAAVLYYMHTSPVNVASIDRLREICGFSDNHVAEWLNINVKTLRNYKSGQTSIKEHVQEKVVILLSLFKHGKKLFGTYEKFTEWLDAANFFFDKKSPETFLKTYSGTKYLDGRLTAMEYGDNV